MIGVSDVDMRGAASQVFVFSSINQQARKRLDEEKLFPGTSIFFLNCMLFYFDIFHYM
jgi:hypothetical protein